MDIDDVYVQIGEFGIQQKIYFSLLCLFNFYAPFFMVQYVFIGRDPHFTCIIQNVTYNNTCGPGNLVQNCDRLVFDDTIDSLAVDWSLVCSDTYKLRMVQSLFMAGIMIGALFLGPVTDKIGRRRMLALSLFGMISTGIVSSFMRNYYVFVVIRFLNGFLCAGSMLSSFVLAMELVGPSMRGFCGNVYQAFFAFGIMGYSLMAYLAPQWRLLCFLASCVGAFCLFILMIVPESPRWLLTHERSSEARSVLKMIAERNGKLFPSDLTLAIPSPASKKGSILDVFKRKKTCVITVIQLYSWFVNSAVYYGLTLASDSLGTNLYISSALLGAVELPAYVITAILLETVGRRIPLALLMILGAIACLLIQFLSHIPHFVMISALIGKLTIAGSFAIIYIHTAEIYPTVVRNGGLGICSCFARIGGIVAPFFAAANAISPSLQFTIFGLLGLSSGLLNLFLPETLNKTLPETLDDMCASGEGEGDSLFRNVRTGRYEKIISDPQDLSEDENENSDVDRVEYSRARGSIRPL